jgi:uncharacterized protein (DUF433 family)
VLVEARSWYGVLSAWLTIPRSSAESERQLADYEGGPAVSVAKASFEDVLEFPSANEIRMRGHRIGLEHVLTYYLEGYSAAQIADEFPGLAQEQIEAAITYYLTNKRSVDAYLAMLGRRTAESERVEAAVSDPEVVRRIRSLKAARQLHARG